MTCFDTFLKCRTIKRYLIGDVMPYCTKLHFTIIDFTSFFPRFSKLRLDDSLYSLLTTTRLLSNYTFLYLMAYLANTNRANGVLKSETITYYGYMLYKIMYLLYKFKWLCVYACFDSSKSTGCTNIKINTIDHHFEVNA